MEPLLAVFGSPPRAWGQPQRVPNCPVGFRFTPTRVGTTRKGTRPRRPATVHPHARGDNQRSPETIGTGGGSPPRAWGQRLIPTVTHVPLRFTPTRVGTTPMPTMRLRSPSVHPHARGDNKAQAANSDERYGSPPRAWGQQLRFRRARAGSRFTPTRVGTTVAVTCHSFPNSVHPHARGDNLEAFVEIHGVTGSPPRAWGQLAFNFSNIYSPRFTPTRVGTTRPCISRRTWPSVHPHARGDNPLGTRQTFRMYGSPPRAWGQLRGRCGGTHRLRFTPTRVGTTASRARSRERRAVHPHARGDNVISGRVRVARPVHPHARGDNVYCSVGRLFASGSPPRAWGQQR